MATKPKAVSRPSTMTVGRTSSILLVCLALIVMTLAVYLQVRNFEFTQFDDDTYITENVHVTQGLTGKNILWALSSVEASNWHPVTWVSHMADVQVYGMTPGGHHLTNVMIHTASTLLLFFLLFRITGSLWQSSFVAALFAIHPLHVESVAWVAERKDVLSAFFWFLTLLCYCEYATHRKRGLYLLCLVTFALGLMAKPMLVTLPIVMLLMDYWPLDRFRHREPGRDSATRIAAATLVREKIPFLACSLASAAMTVYAQNRGSSLQSLQVIPFGLRLENAIVAYATYLVKTLWPRDLCVLYLFPLSIPPWQVIGSLVLLLGVSFTVIRLRSRHPYLLMGWSWFIVSLFTVIGLIQVGSQAMADRYTYLPLVGLFIMAAWGVPDLIRGVPHRNAILGTLASGVLLVSAALTWQQLGYWHDDSSLFRRVVQISRNNYVAHVHLGVDLSASGELNGAIREFREALKIYPGYLFARNDLGTALAGKGDLEAAMQEYQRVILDPHHSEPQNRQVLSYAHTNMGDALVRKGDPAAAIAEYQVALQVEPEYWGAHYKLGVALSNKGSVDAAISEYQEVLRLKPVHVDAHNCLGLAFASKGDVNAAINEFQEVLRLNPNYTDAHIGLGLAFAGKGDLAQAIQRFQKALQINPNNMKAQNYLRVALSQQNLPGAAGK